MFKFTPENILNWDYIDISVGKYDAKLGDERDMLTVLVNQSLDDFNGKPIFIITTRSITESVEKTPKETTDILNNYIMEYLLKYEYFRVIGYPNRCNKQERIFTHDVRKRKESV